MPSTEDSSAPGAVTERRAAERGGRSGEASACQLVRLEKHVNVTDAVLTLLQRSPHQRVYAVRNGSGGWIDVTISAFVDQVRRVARGLMGLGVKPGERVAVMAQTGYPWAVVDQAVWFAGGVSVPIYETSSVQQAVHVLRDSGATLALAGSEKIVGKLRMAAARSGDIPVFRMGSSADLDVLAESGGEISGDELEQARRAAQLDELATIVYTAGTCGPPKGVRITHGNLAEGAANALGLTTDILGGDESRTVIFLPLAHVLGRMAQVMCLHKGVQVAHSPSVRTLQEDLRSFRPTWIVGVPRVFEKVYHEAEVAARSQGRGRLFEAARTTAIQYSEMMQAQTDDVGPGPTLGLRMRHRMFQRLVYPALHERFGGSMRYMISGASPLSTEIAHFFNGVGLPIQEGYGLTETTAPITLNAPGATRIGTVGRPVPGATVRIAEDGEILLAGPSLFDGYRGAAEPFDAESFDEEGFFRTGDIGLLDTDGYLRVLGRKNEVIVTSQGVTVWPMPLEEQVRMNPLVAQCIVVGHARPFTGALLTLDADVVADWSSSRGLGVMSLVDAAKHQDLREEIRAAIDRANTSVSPAQAIRDFTVLDIEFGGYSGYMTPSMKLRRQLVVSDFEEIIADMYSH
ncbi:MAG TPA: AMP-dependent synthetase/ligase [Candidatus Nesterenkonia stercoripullorum]|uniref:Acyl-CoA synthetase n=1 Tax=Candidatus Nesterenkonia stercoripullorum TaxID=2838701 RepID=A0A9D1S0Q9_9MICC|nr:AMP-dependent synthetase/ligase [Candidatus Nesterenkonia stercoripullorum]